MDKQNVTLNLIDTDWHPVCAELSINPETVEIRCRERLVAVQDRERLRGWLAKPDGPLICEEMSWLWNGWSFSIYIPDVVPAFALAFPVVDDLRRKLAPPAPVSR